MWQAMHIVLLCLMAASSLRGVGVMRTARSRCFIFEHTRPVEALMGLEVVQVTRPLTSVASHGEILVWG